MRRLLLITLFAASPSLVLAQAPTLAGCPVFPADNVWNTPIDKLPVDKNSDTYVSTIGPSDKLHPDYGAGGGIPYTLVDGSQAKVSVSFYYQSDAGPYPIPDNVNIEPTADHHAIIVDTTNCILYEIFNLSRGSDGSWNAGSGAIWSLHSNKLRPAGWTSADAAGLAILPGLVRYDEVLAGHINHAIRFTAPQTRDTYIWPARHFASTLTGQQYPQFGQRFRLKADYDISGFAPHVQVILQALKTYGMILADNGTSWHIAGVGDSRIDDTEMHQLTQVVGSDFEAVDESSLIVDPNSGQAQSGSSDAPSGWVTIISENSGKCMDVSGGASADSNGVPIQQWTCNGGTDEQFEFTAVSGGYEITARSSGLQLDVTGGPSATENGAVIQQWKFWGGSNQIFQLIHSSDGYYEISPNNSGKCLDVTGISKDDGALIQQWSCWGGANQKWSFQPAS